MLNYDKSLGDSSTLKNKQYKTNQKTMVVRKVQPSITRVNSHSESYEKGL